MSESMNSANKLHTSIFRIKDTAEEAFSPLEAFQEILDGANGNGAECHPVHVATVLEASVDQAKQAIGGHIDELRGALANAVKGKPEESSIPTTPGDLLKAVKWLLESGDEKAFHFLGNNILIAVEMYGNSRQKEWAKPRFEWVMGDVDRRRASGSAEPEKRQPQLRIVRKGAAAGREVQS